MTKTNNGYIFQAVAIARTENGYSVKNTEKVAIEFKLLRDAQNYIAANWAVALVEAQF